MRIVLLAALLTSTAFAQHRGGAAPVGRTSAPPPPTAYRPPPAPVHPAAPVRPYFPPRPVYVPYPVFIGGGYYAPPVASDYGYTNAAPVAVVNQSFQSDAVNPSIVDYSNVPLPAPDATTDESVFPDDQPTIFLIALTDHTVVAAIAYWVDGDTLNWVSRDAKQNHMSLSLVDRNFSKQLNDQRHVEFKLPPANE